MLLSPETFDILQKGGSYLLMLIAIIWLVADRSRLLKSLSEKDAALAQKEAQVLSLAERSATTTAEFRSTIQACVDIFNKRSR